MKPILLGWFILAGLFSNAQHETLSLPAKAVLLADGKYQYVNAASGKPLNKNHWDSILLPVNGYARAFSNGNAVHLDNKGEQVSKKKYDAIRNFYNGLAAVARNNRWGFIDTYGKEIIPPQYEQAGDYMEGSITVLSGSEWKIINGKGEFIRTLPATYKGSQQTIVIPEAPKPSAYITTPSLAQRTTAAVACPPNLDFEYGNFSNWSAFSGTVAATGNTNQVSVSLTTPLPNRHEVFATGTTAVDQFGLFPVNPGNGSGYAVKLGNNQVGGQAERIRYVINVPYPANDYSITFQYAVVFENPDSASGQTPHTDWEQPRFTAKMYDPLTNEYLSCASFTYVASAVPGFFTSTVPSTSASPAPIKYKPWSSVYVDLSDYAGKTLFLEFTTTDCTLGGHFGYAYVDIMECGVAAQVQYSCLPSHVTTLTAPPGFQSYTWYNSNFSTLLGTGQNITFNPGPAPGTEYQVVLEPFNNTDCDTCDCTDTLKVTVTPSFPVSDAGPDRITCSGNAVNIGTAAKPNYSYQWFPTAGLSNPAAANTTANPAVSTRYYVTTTDNATGCSAVDSVDVTVNPNPAAAFGINLLAQCANQNSFVFTNTSSPGGLNFQWNFGDSSSSVLQNPAHSYSNAGTYTIKLYATSANGCMDSSSRQVTVMPAPVAGYTINNPNQCQAGNRFIFTPTTVGVTNYAWDIGGFNTIQANPQYSFAQAGSYIVKLLVTAANGCKDSLIRQVNVYPQPQANFFINKQNQCFNGNTFIVNNLSNIGNGSLTYNWTFGDSIGVSSTVSPIYSYVTPGDFIIRLVTTSNFGCVDSLKRTVSVLRNPVVDFDVNSGSQCLPSNNFVFTNNSYLPFGSISYEWDFGDGTFSNQILPSHSYVTPGSYTVTLMGTGNNGCIGMLSQPLSVYAIPQVSISPSTASFCDRDTAIINATASAGSGSILRYAWYKDGIPVPVFGLTTQIPVTQAGSYDLVVTNSNGCSNRSNAASVIVYPLPTGSILPPASTTICEGSSVLLEATPGSNYQWFYNGSPITSAVTNSIFANTPGSYSVRLTNQYGCTSWGTNTMLLDYVNKPNADFLFSERCMNIPLRFSNISNVSTSGPIAWHWDFGNGATSSVFNPEPVFTAKGIYPIKLKITSTICSFLADSITKYITIVEPPAAVRYPTVNVLLGTPQQLQARNIGTQYLWRPPVGISNATVVNPLFDHDADQEYQIRIKMATGCVVTDTVMVRVHSEGDVFVPRAWSPNNDGHNDRLYPILVGMMELKVFRVFNRWGQVMFETTQPRQGWDGVAYGQPQPNDTYTWTVEAVYPDGRPLKRSGNSILMR